MCPDTRIEIGGAVNEAGPARPAPRYLSGFGNELASEALPGVLPQGRNAPQESRLVVRPTRFALETPALQANYDACWAGFDKRFEG